MSGMLRMTVDGNLRNGQDVGNVRNVKNFRNVRTDIKCNTFLEPQPRVGLNNDGNLKNGRNPSTVI